MNTTPDDEPGATPTVNLGLQLRSARKRSGYTLRELARRLGVSPSFLSQVENGKAQPSVATLYSLAQVLEVSIDHLFEQQEQTGSDAVPAVAGGTATLSAMASPGASDIPSFLQQGAALRKADGEVPTLRRSDPSGSEQVWEGNGNTARLSVTEPGRRARLVMDSGVIWEQLATNTAHEIDFIEITYPPGSNSTSDERMLRHEGYEYGYLLEGELEVTLGFEAFTLHAGEALGLNSSIPHLFRNRGDISARGIWFVHHRHG